ncbi:hypothetical protein BBBOND_0102070 [Babesia bigemina]|uniref:Uncharacterized protein n=1 Tax=Babesia bigemina TaxID=5866 RepID=A0A061CZP4_BABBI|nr:hypothetical protein BBBOND_0102070 [Babesia bigemina]CDR93878.1 hypothetical protein BBBOND_0102070 [Babesia bigemina]|eukprot:XP_012766064.1 hypothetical protein BBBOND_0102070 [Babesia bigemina]
MLHAAYGEHKFKKHGIISPVFMHSGIVIFTKETRALIMETRLTRWTLTVMLLALSGVLLPMNDAMGRLSTEPQIYYEFALTITVNHLIYAKLVYAR